MFKTLNEIPIFLCCFYGGVVIGIVYDFFRILRIGRHAVLIHLADALFGICAFIIAALVLLIADNGTVRLYSLFAIALGATLWQFFPSTFMRMLISSLISRLSKER